LGESSDDAPELREIDEEDLDQDWEEEEEDGPLESTPSICPRWRFGRSSEANMARRFKI
jgi:hypothetical protein